MNEDWGKQLTAAARNLKLSNDMNNWLEMISELSENCKQQIEELQIEAKTSGQLGKSMTAALKNSISSFTQAINAPSVTLSILKALKQMTQEVYALDAAAADLQMTTGYSRNKTRALLETYKDLADEVGVTTTNLAASASEWLKQGKSIEETRTLIRDSIILSKIGNIEADKSIEYLSSAIKGFNLSTEDVLNLIDKLSAVDMTSALDIKGLAEGISEAADNAGLAGISIDKLLGYITAISEAAQTDIANVGSSLDTIFSRINNLKLGKLEAFQNNGESLSNVEAILLGENISLRDSADNFRNLGEVLDEVASKWDSFSEVSQRAIAGAFAGTNHMEDFLVLMSNYNTALNYAEIASASSGQAMQKFEAYEESLEGKTQRLSNAFQVLSDTVINSDLIGAFLVLGTLGAKGLDTLFNFIDPLTVAFAGLTAFWQKDKSKNDFVLYGCESI